MTERVQYAAITDLENVVKELAKRSKGPVAVVYDPRRGWCFSDEVRIMTSRRGAEEPAYGCQAYKDWFEGTIGEALASLFAVRFMPGSLVGRLFRKPPQPARASPPATGGQATR